MHILMLHQGFIISLRKKKYWKVRKRKYDGRGPVTLASRKKSLSQTEKDRIIGIGLSESDFIFSLLQSRNQILYLISILISNYY